jgi:hypothetical protein
VTLVAADRTLDDADRLRQEFAAARPFPHVVIEDVLTPDARSLASAFPPIDWGDWHRYPDEYQRVKMICKDIEQIPAPLKALIGELSSPSFLGFLERISGIDALLTDPYLEGGGLHCSGPGGILAPHTDFHLYRRLQLYRRLNLLLYLNESWEAEWGGCLELFAPTVSTPERVVVPTWGKCVIFRTDDRSPHGFTKPITGERWRRSVALYYYTAEEDAEYSGDTNTYWRQDRETATIRRARQRAYQALIFGSRTLAFAAHRIDPKLSRRR